MLSVRGARLALLVVLAAACRRTPSATHRSGGLVDAGVASDPFLAIHWGDAPLDWTRPLPVTPAGGIAEPGYVGAAACKPCHVEIYASYARHAMAETGLRPLSSLDPKWLAAIFDAGAGAPVRHANGFAYRPYRDGDRYYVEETLDAPDGTRIESWILPVTHALGAGAYGMAFYLRRGERLVHAPIDYYAKLARWDLDPFATGGNPRFLTTMGVGCIACHGDPPRRSAAVADAFYDPLPAGIGCERCHGPGARHVETLRREDIVNPARLGQARQLDVCTQCHLQRLASMRADRDELAYRPGEPLDAFRVNWLPESEAPDRLALLAHPERLVRSACFLRSAGKLTCTSCHDPHVSSREEPAAWWDGKCMACHAEKPCTEDHVVRAKVGDHCAGCHMRRGATANVPLVEITDHWIQRRPSPIRPGPEDPPGRLVTWGSIFGESATGDDLLATEAVAHDEVGHAELATKLGAQAMAAGAHVPKLYDLAVKRLSRRGPAALAQVYASALRWAPDSRWALLGYARVMLGGLDATAAAEGARALARLLALDPDDADALELQGMVRFRAGRVDDARASFTRATTAGLGAPAAHVGLAALALHDGRTQAAIAELELARRLEPSDAWVLDRLASAYAAAGDREHADALARIRAALARGPHPPAPTPASAWLPPDYR